MNNDNFSHEAEKTISYIADEVEKQDPEGIIDIDFTVDMLNLSTPKGEYVINKHSAAREIWVASPISGPYHFFNLNGLWITKNNIELMDLLSSELSQFTELKLS